MYIGNSVRIFTNHPERISADLNYYRRRELAATPFRTHSTPGNFAYLMSDVSREVIKSAFESTSPVQSVKLFMIGYNRSQQKY